MVAQSVKRPGIRRLKRGATELTLSLIPGRGMGGRKNPSRAIYEASLEVSARFGK